MTLPRRFPEPCRAALALSIDCDGCTVPRLREVFSHWRETLGLAVASSMFLFSRNPSAPPQASYFDGDRDALRELYGKGWIDTLHSLGDLVQPVSRDEAARAFEELRKDGVAIDTWTNHGGPENVQNLLRANALGDCPDSPAYVADLAREYGIRYLWASELTHLVGQDRAAGAGEYYGTYPGATAARRWGARLAHPVSEAIVRALRVEPYPGNALLRSRTLRDGGRLHTFLRHGVWREDTITRLPRILDERVLDLLVEREGTMAVYLHIGPSRDETLNGFLAGLRTLDAVARRKEIWVARTSDLLRHAAARDEVR